MIARVCRKVARENAADKKARCRITPDKLEHYLGIPQHKENEIEKGDRIGTAVGLAWTSQGGDILNIQATLMKGKGIIQLTGRLGEMMKESAQAAVSFLRSHGSAWGIPADLLTKQDIHIHIPDGATPKDGPSAGITLATALVSAVTGRPVPADVAMTGEITLRGHVLAIGGLAEKVMAAKRAGIPRIYVPESNRPDWFDLDEDLRKGVAVTFVERVEEVWAEIFAQGKGKRRSRSRSAQSAGNRPC